MDRAKRAYEWIDIIRTASDQQAKFAAFDEMLQEICDQDDPEVAARTVATVLVRSTNEVYCAAVPEKLKNFTKFASKFSDWVMEATKNGQSAKFRPYEKEVDK